MFLHRYSSNVLELNAYFQDLQVKVLTQQPAYGTESLLGKYASPIR